MKSSDMIRQLCKEEKITLSELARRLGQSPQNFDKKLIRDTVTFGEMMEIADVVGVLYEQAFILKNGERIKLGSPEKG